MTLSVAKNAMYRAIEGLYYRPLKKAEKELIWKYFESRCAYCDKVVDRILRHGYMDHLDCSAAGGGNYIRNRVLACKECNGNEKREKDWHEFLRSKCVDTKTFCERERRIKTWQSQFSLLPPLNLSAEANSAKKSLITAIQNFEKEFVRFRSLIPKRRPPLT